jgi:HSP20 family molecular chaperone IbpA
VRLRLTITPAGAPATVIFRRAAYPGTSFESAEVPPSTAAEEVKIKAPGYERQDIQITLDRDLDLRVELKRSSKRMKLFDF